MKLTGLVEARLLTVDDIWKVAKRRGELHSKHSTRRPLGDHYDFVGLVGQWVFAKKFGLEVDLTDRPQGDGRINFYTDIGTISVSTYRKPYNLLREVDKECADYHVLAKFKGKFTYWGLENYQVHFRGWESDEEMLKCPTRDFGYGVINHFKYVRELRPMIELESLLLGYGIQEGLF